MFVTYSPYTRKTTFKTCLEHIVIRTSSTRSGLKNPDVNLRPSVPAQTHIHTFKRRHRQVPPSYSNRQYTQWTVPDCRSPSPESLSALRPAARFRCNTFWCMLMRCFKCCCCIHLPEIRLPNGFPKHFSSFYWSIMCSMRIDLYLEPF